MRMTKAWLILADIVVMLLFLFSFILLYLYPLKSLPKHLPLQSLEQNITFESLQKPIIGQDIVITEEELQMLTEKNETAAEIVQDHLFSVPLKQSLKVHDVKIGDAVFIRIFKEESTLEVWMKSDTGYKHVKNYFICAYSGGLGPKEKEGDRQSPEGFYDVKRSALNPKSKFHLSFNLGYPNAYDRAHNRTGSFLMVHGNCVSIGCYAMTDKKIEEIYALVETALKNGQKFVPVHIFPFRMTEVNMAEHSENKWFNFWMNLKEGYDYFEAQGLPPTIEIKEKRYVIHE